MMRLSRDNFWLFMVTSMIVLGCASGVIANKACEWILGEPVLPYCSLEDDANCEGTIGTNHQKPPLPSAGTCPSSFELWVYDADKPAICVQNL